MEEEIKYPFYFVAPTVSDVWGNEEKRIGRIRIPNPWEHQWRDGERSVATDAPSE